jgi:hypothetical protein
MEKNGKTDMVNLFLLGLQTSKGITIDLYKCETCKRIFGVANIKGIKGKKLTTCPFTESEFTVHKINKLKRTEANEEQYDSYIDMFKMFSPDKVAYHYCYNCDIWYITRGDDIEHVHNCPVCNSDVGDDENDIHVGVRNQHYPELPENASEDALVKYVIDCANITDELKTKFSDPKKLLETAKDSEIDDEPTILPEQPTIFENFSEDKLDIMPLSALMFFKCTIELYDGTKIKGIPIAYNKEFDALVVDTNMSHKNDSINVKLLKIKDIKTIDYVM